MTYYYIYIFLSSTQNRHHETTNSDEYDAMPRRVLREAAPSSCPLAAQSHGFVLALALATLAPLAKVYVDGVATYGAPGASDGREHVGGRRMGRERRQRNPRV